MLQRKQLGIAVVGAGRIGSLRAQLAAGHSARSSIPATTSRRSRVPR